MNLKLTDREQDTLKKLASLGSMYQPLHNEATTLSACGLIESNGVGGVRINDKGRKYLRDLDIRFVQTQSPF